MSWKVKFPESVMNTPLLCSQLNDILTAPSSDRTLTADLHHAYDSMTYSEANHTLTHPSVSTLPDNW